MNKNGLIIFSSLCVLLFISCSNIKEANDSPINTPLLSRTKLDHNSLELSSEDAKVLVRQFNSSPQCKVAEGKEIVEIIPIYGNFSRVNMYAVCYSDGYTIVSATKLFHPILAEIEHGHYSAEAVNKVLIGEYNEIIDATRAGVLAPVESSEWHIYEELGSSYVKTKVPDAFYDLLDGYYDAWYDYGYNIYFLYEQPEDMPDEIYESFCSQAEEEDHSNLGYGYMDCSIILEKYHSSSQTIGPLLATTWGQGTPWNDSIPNNQPLGCVTIATGQIMKHHCYPTNIPWSSMPNSSYSSPELCSFLTTLRSQLFVPLIEISNIYMASTVLQSYGYDCSIVSHTYSQPYSEITNNRPVYMRGIEPSSGEGHAWVCDGHTNYYTWVEYQLFTLQISNNQPVAMINIDSVQTNQQSTGFYHMNLGWGGFCNGNYQDGPHFYINAGNNNYDFCNNRLDLLISK